MLYAICNKFGETTGKQVSDADPKFTGANPTAFRDGNENPIMSVAFDGKIYFALTYQGEETAAPVDADSDTPDEIHVPVDDEPSSD